VSNRRDMEECSWCGERREEIPIERAEALVSPHNYGSIADTVDPISNYKTAQGEPKFFLKCKDCGRFRSFVSDKNMNRAVREGKLLCRECACRGHALSCGADGRYIGSTCPVCKVVKTYASAHGARASMANQAPCRRCTHRLMREERKNGNSI